MDNDYAYIDDPLVIAIREDHAHIVEYLIKKFSVKINIGYIEKAKDFGAEKTARYLTMLMNPKTKKLANLLY